MATRSKYDDVFIDFLGKDTRYSFVSHLTVALRRRRMSVLLSEDNTLPLPEGVKVFVVVFSENYAFSPQCLNTLMEFLERQRQKRDGLVVVPVCYGGVTRPMVEQQTGKFEAAFTKHESLYTKDQLAKWRIALKETASLPGHESTTVHPKKDSELVEEIVDDVYEKLDPTGKIGVYSRLLGIESLLCKPSHNIRHLGIWGMPGVGKTAIARAVYNQMSYDFEDSCYVEDFHTSFHEKGLYQLRDEQFKKDGESKKEGESTDRTCFLEKVREKRVLFVLDDVRNPMDVESFLGGFQRRKGSLIIITSRDKQVLCQCQVDDVYEVPRLSEAEALRLLTHTALPGKEPSDTKLIELSKKIIEYANGNPLALTLFSKALSAKEMEADFEKMRRCLLKEILCVFRTSYDALSDNERNIFLDIACFFKGTQLDQIIHILEGCGFFPHVGIDRLVELSLLTRSEKKKVEMHSLIQDIGRAFANEENKQMGRRRRLWELSRIRSVLEDNEPKGTEAIEGIFLDTTDVTINVNHMAFENMYNLRLLKIYSSNSETAQELHLREGLYSLPYELRLLHWEKYPLRFLPKEFDASHLVELNMPYSQLQHLWEGTKSLANLKIINLSYSQKLLEVDELSKACSLVKIYLQGCTSLESIPHTDELKNLKLLNLFGCTSIKRKEIVEKTKGLKETEPMVFSK